MGSISLLLELNHICKPLYFRCQFITTLCHNHIHITITVILHYNYILFPEGLIQSLLPIAIAMYVLYNDEQRETLIYCDGAHVHSTHT